MKTRSILTLILALASLSVFSQNETDALRYSMLNPGGTARFMSMGGAFGALGGDFSSLSVNPAGIGLYKSSEFTITPQLNQSTVGSKFYGNTEEDLKFNFNLSNLGLVFAFGNNNPVTESGWKGFQVGFGITQMANFNNRLVYEGFNPHSSLLSQFVDDAFATSNPNTLSGLNPFTTRLAVQTYLIDTINGNFIWDPDLDAGNVRQNRIENTQGGIREMAITLGANFSDRLYLGAAFGFPRVNYESESVYTETENYYRSNVDGLLYINEYFDKLEFKDRLKVHGTGFNFKAGAIFRATDMIRLGASVQTPTFYSLEQKRETELEVHHVPMLYDDFGIDKAKSPKGIFEYELNTPLRLTGSLGLVFQTYGLLSLDYEYLDFSQMRMRSNNYTFSAENKTIQNNFTTQHNIRLGGEVRLNPIVLRAGYAIHTSPFESGVNDGARTTLSTGIGFRDKNFFLDFAYYYTQYAEKYYPYSAQLTEAVNYDFKRNSFALTAGFRF